MSLLPRKRGRDIRVKDSDGVVVAGGRSKRIIIDNQTVDVTTDDDSGFIKLLARAARKQLNIELTGFTVSDLLRDTGIEGIIGAYTVEYLSSAGNVDYSITSDWFITSYRETGPHDNGVDFTVSMTSSADFHGDGPPTPVDPITTSSISSSTLTLSWSKATDDVTAQANLQYEVRQSTSANIDTLANAEANGTIIQAYATDIDTFDVIDLTVETAYYFTVIVRDEAGHKAAYSMITETTGLLIDGTGLTPSDAGTSDRFGGSCALSDAGTTSAVGAYLWDGAAGSDQGAIYIFDWNGSSWDERTTALTPSDASASDFFGSSCALSDAGTTLAVGAYRWDGAAGSDQGAIYIFDWNGSSWD